MIRNKKKLICFVTLLVVAITLLGVSVYTTLSPTAPKQALADAVVGDRIEMIDLWERYPIRVIGPLASKNALGQYVDGAGNRVKDKYGEYTNNIYQIPADQYYNAENYLYTEYNDDVIDIGTGKGRTLYGWKPNIEPVALNTGVEINEDGYIINNNSATTRVGIYVKYLDEQFYGTLGKYALIVPDDVTQVGQGNGAFVTNGYAYYGYTFGSGVTEVTRESAETTFKFTDFSSFIFLDSQSLGLTKSTYFQPRERLAGVYFSERSKLHTIHDGTADAETGMDKTNRSSKQCNGKSAFAYCDNMRFFILPDGVKTIGRGAFYKCTQLTDVNIPAKVGETGGSLGINAFYDCASLLHITVPSGVAHNDNVFRGCSKLKDVENLSDNFTESDFKIISKDTKNNPSSATLFNYQTVAKKSALYVVGGEPTYNEDGEKVYDAGLNGFIFCQNVKGDTSTFATISGYNQSYQKDKWYAIGISGDPDTNGDKVYVLPETFNDSSDRRKGIKYDYIDAGGHKCKNSIGSTETSLVKKYDIAKAFANGTWCVNIVMTKATEIIGDSAFRDSHTRYMETYATYIGKEAFAYDTDVGANQGNAQWYYFHQNGTYQTYRIGTSAFSNVANSKTRYCIFEDKTLFDKVMADGSWTSIKNTGSWAKYQIPVYVNVYSEVDEDFTVTESNMAQKFFNDSDFGDVTIQANANNKIVITKRLSGYAFNNQKQDTGYWAANDKENQTYPTLSNMISTVWYSDENYTNKISNTGLGIGNSDLYQLTNMTALNVYAKNLGAPNLPDQTYQYNVDVSASKTLTLYQAVKLPTNVADSDFITETTADFTSFTGTSGTANVVQNAGIYTVPIVLNSDKWGVWDSKARSYSVKVTVNRAEFDLGNPDNLPKFAIDGGADLGGTGEGTTIYQYPDGWYQYPTDKTPSDSKVVLNSFVRHTGSPITIAGNPSDDKMYHVIRSGGYTQTNSDSYLGSFSLEMKNTNYVFSTASYDKNAETFQKLGIIFTDSSEATDDTPKMHITKRWYIVIQTNWLIDSTAPAETITPYALLTFNNVATSTLPYEATFNADNYAVHIPKLARGTANLTFTMTYGATMIVPEDNPVSVTNLPNYVNSAMPAGTYTVTISAPGVTVTDSTSGDTINLPAIRDIIRLTVTPKAISAGNILALLGKNQAGTFEHAYVSTQVNLYDDTTAGNLTSLIADLENGVGVNTERANATADNIWKSTDFDSYYDDVKISYNLDRMRTTAYYENLATFGDLSLVPSEVGKYLVYYSLSAKNYQSVGGANADDRRDYRFNTVIYRELSLTEIANTIRATGTTPYPYVYNKGVINANVPYSAFYTYTFSGDRINATKSDSDNKPTVTLSITDSELTRWAPVSDDAIKIINNGKAATVTYNIQQATNSWFSPLQVPAWSYDGFTPEVHTIIGKLTYSPATVYYRIGTAETVGNEIQYNAPINMNGTLQIDGVTQPTYFEVGENGIVENEDVIAVLKGLDVLPAGEFYYLESYVFDTEDGNVKGLSEKSPFHVYLTKAQNYWETTPALTPYQYQQYNYDFIAGVPHYTTEDTAVTYKIRGGANLSTKDGTLDEDAIAELNKLTVGTTYYIDVDYDGGDNYQKMTTYTIPFSVMQSQSNPWVEGTVTEGDTEVTYSIPNISNWTYGGYAESLLTMSKAKFGTVSYTVKTADENMNSIANVPGFVGLSYTALQAKLTANELNAGNYRLYATSEGTTIADRANFVAATRDVGFRVAKAQNKWATGKTPAISGWTYGETANIPIEGVAEYEYDEAKTEVTRQYFTAHTNDDGSWSISNTTPLASISDAGNYLYVTTVPETTNYLELKLSVPFRVERAGNSWATNCEPEGMFTWTWGNIANSSPAIENSGFINAAAAQMTDDKLVTYTVSGAGFMQTIVKKTVAGVTVLTVDDEAFSGSIVDCLKKLNVGNYQVSVSVKETANYAGVTKVTYLTVNPASFEWATEPADSGWTWGDVESKKVFTQPTIKAIAVGDTAKFTYVLGVKGSDATTTYDTENAGKTPYAQLLESLKGKDAATYAVTVSVSCDNYTTLTKTVEVEIKQATNVWTANAPAEMLVREYDNKHFAMATPTAKYGTVTYYYGGTNTTDIATVNQWINERDKSTTPYTISIQVQGTDNYTGLSVTTELTVTGVQSHWKNEGSLSDSYSFAYDNDLLDNLASVVIPDHDTHSAPDSPFNDDVLSYTITYKNYKGEGEQTVTRTTADTVSSYLSAHANAGEYTITAEYDPNNTNYSKLKYKITVTVSRATAAWDEEIKTEYINVYEAVEMPTPTAGASIVSVTVKNSDGDTYTLPAGDNLNAYLNTLDVGTYTVTSWVEESDNYTGLTAEETRVVITPATNTWVDTSVFQNVWTFKRNQEINVGIPASQRGTVTYFLDNKGIVLEEGKTLNDYLNAHAKEDLDARDHTLRFYVAPGENGNYNGLAYDCILRITKNDNSWAIGEAPVSAYPNWTGTVNVNDFKIPTPEFYPGLLHFGIEKVVGPATVESAYDLNKTEFTTALAKLVNGTYRVTMRVGGSCANPKHKADDYDADLKKALETYNDDYYELTGTTVITIAPKANKWNDSLVADSTVTWKYGATNNPAVNFDPENAEKMEIRIDNTKITLPDDTSLNDYLKTNYGVGRYLIKATVPANDVYTMLEKVITLRIDQSDANRWEERPTEDGTTIMRLKLNRTWIWDVATRTTQGWDTLGFIAPVPLFGNSVEVTVRTKNGGAELFTVTLTYANNDAGVKTVNQDNYNALRDRLGALDVGEYTATAVIPESTNYIAYTQDPVDFEITKAENTWKSSSDAPHISGWDYTGSTAYPSSDPKYGNKNDVVYSYAPVIISEGKTDDDACENVSLVTTWSNALPYNAGRYYVRGTLPGTTNYEALTGYGTFSINAGVNEWADLPGVISWDWNGYNKDVHQFSASARSGGKVTFSILKQGDSESGYVSVGVNDFLVYNGTQLTANDVKVLEAFSFVYGADGQPTKMIPAEVASVLNALKPGTYRLNAVAASTENFAKKEGGIDFLVGKATNEWATAPNVLSYGYNDFTETGDRKSLTAGQAKYGTANIYYQIIDSKNASILDKTQSVTVLTNKLKALPAGNYVLRAWVPAETDSTNAFYGVYKELYTESSPYPVLFGVTRTAGNSWREGHLPKNPLSEFYTILHGDEFSFSTWFGSPQTDDLNASIVYTLLNTDLTTPAITGEYTLGTLFGAIKELNSGDYVIRLTAKSQNYLDLTADISLAIKRSENDFSLSNSLSGQWRKDGDTYLTTVDDLSFTASYSANVTFTLENKSYTSFDALKQAIKTEGYDAGTYQLTVRVAQTNEYEGFTGTVRLEIAQDDNSWQNQWTIEDSLGIPAAFSTTSTLSWTYGTTINWNAARPKYGTLVYVDIRKTGASEAFSYNDVNYADLDAANSSIRNISKVLSKLDGGDYTLTVSAPADVNWKQKKDSVSFTITSASNAWKTNDLPRLVGATVNEQGVLSYIYDKLAVQPAAAALHGVPSFVYYKEGSDTPLTSIPVNAGSYEVEFIVEETTNYEGLSTSIPFVIAKGTDPSFIVSNGTVGWIYGEYDRLTHVFTGIPRTGGEVSYAVLDSTGKEVITGIVLGDSNGVHHSDFDKDTYVTVADAAKVGALLAGDYRLQINVAEMPNYEGFSATSPFKVSPTSNYWTVTPKITPWSIGLYDPDKNLPLGESRFGSPVIKIVSRVNGEVFFNATFNRTTGKYDIAVNRLEDAPAGMYTMTAKVDIAEGKYLNPLEETVSLEVYKRGSLDEKNYWYDTPGINPWEANIIQLVNQPYGTPLRGLPYFEFYNSKRDENNQIVIDWDNPVKAGEDSILILKGKTYFKDFYMPMKPGYYYMVACAESLDGEGNVIVADRLRETPVQFQIRNRENSFKDEPRIETLLFLGDRITWAQPTAEPMLPDSVLVFTYKNLTTGEDLGTVMPTKEGRYSVTAYAKAKYSEMIQKSVEFVVELSANEWTTHPTIEDWSEEFSATAPDPEAAARYGWDSIEYAYENLATGEIKTEKPWEEGTYRLIATAKLKGYKDLVGTSEFTIGPAFDMDLLIVDIVLATVCCGLSIWLIALAIKKRNSL